MPELLHQIRPLDPYWGDYGMQLFHGAVANEGTPTTLVRAGPFVPEVFMPNYHLLIARNHLVEACDLSGVDVVKISEIVVRSPLVDWRRYARDLSGLDAHLKDAGLDEIEEPDCMLHDEPSAHCKIETVTDPGLSVLLPTFVLKAVRWIGPKPVLAPAASEVTKRLPLLCRWGEWNVLASEAGIASLFPDGVPSHIEIKSYEVEMP